MTLVYERDLDILHMYLRTKSRVYRHFQKLKHEWERQTHRHMQTDTTERITSHFMGNNSKVSDINSLSLI